MKCIILCADDYGQNPAISQAIINLIEKKRISATSCITSLPYWSSQAKWLEPFKNQVDIGLHINLTDGKPVSSTFSRVYGSKMFSLFDLLMKAYLRRLDKNAIADEVNAQLDRYIESMHKLPDFIDGHQHVHQFPIIREIMLEIYNNRLRKNNSYIRCVNDNNIWLRFREDAFIKKLIIQFTGANKLKTEVIKQKIPHNSSFSGIYDFAHGKNYAKKFPQFLKQLNHNGLMMCHPGLESAPDLDPIYSARYDEYQYLMSDDFLRDCESQQVIISRLRII